MSTALLFAVIDLQVSRTLGFAQLSPERAEEVFATLRRAASEGGSRRRAG